MSASMAKCDLKNAPGYVAMSYAWGNSGQQKTLLVNNRPIHISQSLYDALQAVTRSCSYVLGVMVWADALCIDQSNVEERNEQVRMMPSIYENAESVAIWLGPLQSGDLTAQKFLFDLSASHKPLGVLQDVSKETLIAVASLFSRAYWSRLWVVQEIYNAKSVLVYYGHLIDLWSTFQDASTLFQSEEGKRILGELLPANSGRESLSGASNDHLGLSQVLMYQGPAAFGDILRKSKAQNDLESQDLPAHQLFQQLLGVMRLSRSKKVTELRDRVFAMRGVLPERIRDRINVDYSLSLKDIYTDIFEVIVGTTGRLDVMCESIHFPLYRGIVDLASWLPDWSHTPMVSSLAASYPGAFRAHNGTWAEYSFDSPNRDRINIKAVSLGTIQTHGVALNTGCRANDYIRAFEGWRLELMNHFQPLSADTEDTSAWEGEHEKLAAWMAKEEEFCRAISVGKSSKADCYPLFATLIHTRFPYQPLDAELKRHAEKKRTLTRGDRQVLQDDFAENMMGRCFCITSEGDLGLGTGYMDYGDVVVVALGCRTPIILRPQGLTEEGKLVHRFVGDMYLHGYMDGEAIRSGKRGMLEFLIQ